MTPRRRYSLWLLPEPGAAGVFSETIDRIGQQHRGPRFPPHVTILGWLMGDEQTLADRTARLAAGLKPLSLKVAGFGGEPTYFRCLYVRLDADTGIRDAHAAASREFSAGYGKGYLPHVSLHYGRLDADKKTRLIDELRGAVLSGFTVDRLQLVHITVAISDWRVVASFPLEGR